MPLKGPPGIHRYVSIDVAKKPMTSLTQTDSSPKLEYLLQKDPQGSTHALRTPAEDKAIGEALAQYALGKVGRMNTN